MANPAKGNALLADANDKPMISTQQTLVGDIAVTYTAGSAPAASGALTIANSATPTVVELLDFCEELNAKVVALTDILEAHGLMSAT
jgi:hypothetical protein